MKISLLLILLSDARYLVWKRLQGLLHPLFKLLIPIAGIAFLILVMSLDGLFQDPPCWWHDC
ncbi:MAG: hypothetical protein AAB316_04725 [Bacteroidota bacterium]